MLLLLLLSSPAPAGMTLQAENISANGVTLRTVSCDLNSGGFLALIGVVASIAPQKAALDACVPSGAAFEVQWAWQNGKVAQVSVGKSSVSAKNACVQAAVKATTSGVDGSCKAVLLVGDPTGAAAAADALFPPATPAAPTEGTAAEPTPAAPAAPPAEPAPEPPKKKSGIGI